MVKNILFGLVVITAMLGCNGDDEIEITVPDLRKTFIPDDNFEQALIDFGIDDKLDDYVFTEKIIKRHYLAVENMGIKDLTGINDFVNLRSLNCAKNQITELDLSNLNYLEELECWSNKLSNLNLSELENLRHLNCNNNQISQLNLSNLNYLEELECTRNNLTSLNVSELENLKKLTCGINNILKLDLSNNIRLVKLSVNYNYSLNELDLTENILLEQLGVQSTDLKFLNLSNNQYLRYLWCGGSKFSELDLSNNRSLIRIWMPLSQVKVLDLRNNHNLSSLDCFKGNLEKLILGSGNLNLNHLDATENSSLICIQVDDEEKANSGVHNPYKLWEFDDGIIFSEDCP
jgi:Leucine-rich repeat (LRR) protein